MQANSTKTQKKKEQLKPMNSLCQRKGGTKLEDGERKPKEAKPHKRVSKRTFKTKKNV